MEITMRLSALSKPMQIMITALIIGFASLTNALSTDDCENLLNTQGSNPNLKYGVENSEICMPNDVLNSPKTATTLEEEVKRKIIALQEVPLAPYLHINENGVVD